MLTRYSLLKATRKILALHIAPFLAPLEDAVSNKKSFVLPFGTPLISPSPSLCLFGPEDPLLGDSAFLGFLGEPMDIRRIEKIESKEKKKNNKRRGESIS